MPRNSAGVFSVINVFTPNTVISSSQVNANFADSGLALTDSLDRTGKGGMQTSLDFGGFRGVNAADPASPQDIVTQAFGTATYARLSQPNNFTGSPLQYGGIEVGYRSLPTRAFSVSDSTAAADAGTGVIYNGTGGHTFTLNTNTPVSSVILIFNAGQGNLAVSAPSILWYNGSGTLTFGSSRTLAVGAAATVYQRGVNNWYIFGTGIS